MRQRDDFVALRLGNHFFGGGECGLPFVKFQAVLDHFLLTGQAAAFVLFVGFLEFIEGQVSPMLVNFLQGFFKRLLSFFTCGACWWELRKRWHGGNKKQNQEPGIAHGYPPAGESLEREAITLGRSFARSQMRANKDVNWRYP
jgi:hypothetical protein